jgi:hypothetical protein
MNKLGCPMAASVNQPSFFQIDFYAKELSAITESENKRIRVRKTSHISGLAHHVDVIDCC